MLSETIKDILVLCGGMAVLITLAVILFGVG